MPPPVVGTNSAPGSTDQAISPVGTQAGHHQPFIGGRGNYSSFPDNASRMVSHPQQRVNSTGEHRGFGHQDEAPQGGQQSQIWGAPHPHFDRNGRTDIAPLENSHHLQAHHPHPSHYTHHPHKQENSRERERGGEPKKTETTSPLPQPCLSSSCSSSSSSSSAREDGSGKQSLHHPPPQHEHDTGPRGVGGRKQDKTGSNYPQTQSTHLSVHQHHPKSNSRAREQKTETQWGPRPGSSSGPAHNRKGGSGMGGNTGGEDISSQHDKPVVQSGGGNPNRRVGPIKRPVLKEMKREVGEGEGGEKNTVGSAKDKDQDANHVSLKQTSVSTSQASTGKDETAPPGKPRNAGKERGSGGGMGKASKEGENSVHVTSSLVPPSRRDREHSYETGGNSGGATYQSVSSRGGRSNRGRGEFYGRGRGYRGSYAGSARGRPGGRNSRDYRSTTNNSYQHGSSNQDHKREASSGRRGQGSSQANPGRARNHSETRSEGSEYEEVPKRRRQRGSETGSESAASDLAHSDKEDRKPTSKKGTGGENLGVGNASSSAPPRNTQTRVFTPRGVPSRRGRGGGATGGGVYRNSGSGSGMSGGHRSGPSQAVSAKSSTSTRKQHAPPQQSLMKDPSHGFNGEKKEKVPEQGQSLNQSVNSSQISGPMVPTAAQLGTENGGVSQTLTNTNSNSSGHKPVPLPNADGRNVLHRGFERPPRRRRPGRSQHQQDKPPRFRRLKQERENAARINGSSGIIEAVGGQQQQTASPSQNSMQDGTPNVSSTTGIANTNHNISATNNNNSSFLGGGNLNLNSHHHHYHGNSGLPHSQHHHNHNQTGGAKSPDVSNQNSDQANEEWETASESSDFTEYREREGGGGGGGGGGKSYSSYHHHHPSGRGSGGGGVDREIATKESAANKRSFSSQRPGMERQNRRVSAGGGGGRGCRGPPTGGGPSSVSGNGGAGRNERRGNWPSPKNRK